MLCVPTARLLMRQLALLGLPTLSVVAGQPIALPLSVKVTLPLGALPLTVAVRVSVVPATTGVADVASVVIVGALVTSTRRTASAAACPVALLTCTVARAPGAKL